MDDPAPRCCLFGQPGLQLPVETACDVRLHVDTGQSNGRRWQRKQVWGGGWALDDRCSPNKMQPLAQADSLTFPVSRCCLRDQLQAFVEPSRQRAVISQGLICADVPKADVKLHVASVAQGVYKP